MNELTNINARYIPAEEKRKAMFVLKAKGSNLSEEVRKMTKKLAQEFDEMKK